MDHDPRSAEVGDLHVEALHLERGEELVEALGDEQERKRAEGTHAWAHGLARAQPVRFAHAGALEVDFGEDGESCDVTLRAASLIGLWDEEVSAHPGFGR